MLIDADYGEGADHPTPTGKIAWIRVMEEQTMITTLHELGIIKLLSSQPTD